MAELLAGQGSLGKGKKGRKGLLFVNKKKQKNFIRWHPSFLGKTGAKGEKFFGSFFQKRTCFLTGCLPDP
jgi:hypothetical protein